MRQRLRGLPFFALTTLLLALALPASAQDCVAGLQQQRLQFIDQAELCEVDSGLLRSIDQGKETFGRKHCVRPIGYSGGLDAPTECARVHLCALEANNCAIRLARGGMDCRVAMNACLARFPVPP